MLSVKIQMFSKDKIIYQCLAAHWIIFNTSQTLDVLLCSMQSFFLYEAPTKKLPRKNAFI